MNTHRSDSTQTSLDMLQSRSEHNYALLSAHTCIHTGKYKPLSARNSKNRSFVAKSMQEEQGCVRWLLRRSRIPNAIASVVAEGIRLCLCLPVSACLSVCLCLSVSTSVFLSVHQSISLILIHPPTHYLPPAGSARSPAHDDGGDDDQDDQSGGRDDDNGERRAGRGRAVVLAGAE